MARAAHVRKGDLVIVTSGSHKGKKGKILEVRGNRVVVEKVAMIKKHSKPTQASPKGGIVEKEGTVHISNVALFDEKTDRGTRTKVTTEGTKKIRVGVKSGTKFQAAAAAAE